MATHRGRRSSRGEERRRLWVEAHFDSLKDEVVATETYPLLDIRQGEVLRQGFRYLHPALERREMRGGYG